MIHLVDGNNYFRRVIEKDSSGVAIRNMIGAVERSSKIEVWVWDGPGGLKRRREVYPRYKEKRNNPGEDFFKFMDWFRGLLIHTRAIQILVPGWEADDVIATLAQKYDVPVDITSTDKDFLQLCQHSGITIDRDPISGVDASDIRLFKTLVGDPSDKITGITGFGAKAWDECNKEAFRELLERHVGHLDLSPDTIMEDFGVSKRVANWMLDDANLKLLHTMWDIIGFYPVPMEEIEAHTFAGTSNPQALEAQLQEFHQ